MPGRSGRVYRRRMPQLLAAIIDLEHALDVYGIPITARDGRLLSLAERHALVGEAPARAVEVDRAV